MKRNIKKTIKKAVVAVAAASMLTVLTLVGSEMCIRDRKL